MKKRKNGNLKNKKQMLIIIAVISIMVFICVVMQAYIEGYFGDGKGKSTKAVNENSVQKKSDRTDAEAGINQISDVVQSNSANAEETSATSEELSAQAETMNELISKFILEKK